MTGQLSVPSLDNRRAPFNNVKLHFNGGVFAPLANPLLCGNSEVQSAFNAYSERRHTAGAGGLHDDRLRLIAAAVRTLQGRRRCRRSVGSTTNFTFTMAGPKASST